MSERSIRRANERRAAKARRREAQRRRRTGLATGAAIGATALFATGAQAATFEVNSPADGPPDACDATCTLRDAITQANSTAEADTITFAGGLAGPIVLTEGELAIGSAGVTINGPGAGALTISGDADDNGPDAGDFRIFSLGATGESTISGLTLTEGWGSNDGTNRGNGGAVFAGSPLTLSDAVVSASTTTAEGGGVYADSDVTIRRTTISGNSASSGGGVGGAVYDDLAIADSTVSGNQATGGDGAGVYSDGPLTITSSTISGNTGATEGGGVWHGGKYASLDIADSVISGNGADAGGGVAIEPDDGKYDTGDERVIRGTTIRGNSASYDGGGLYVPTLNDGDRLTISRSTISGNGSEQTGGGIRVGGDGESLYGDMLVSNSTVSGNTADSGGGISFGGDGDGPPLGGGSVELASSTIAANTAARGGGIYLNSYGSNDDEPVPTSATIPLTSTVVADNTGQDLDRDDDSTGGGFDLAFSLVEAPGDAPLFQSPDDANIVGSDPQLGGLGDNGGPTATHVPAQTSPLVDRGDAPPRLDTDQRGRPRTLDGAPPNAPGGDGTDIGSVEIDRVPAAETPPGQTQQTPPPPPQAPPQVVLRRVRPRGIVVRVTPRRDRTEPFTFTTTGRIVPPAGMSRAAACSSLGIVSVQVKRRGTTISTRRARVRRNCTFTSRVTFQERRRFGKARRLKFTVRFTGNQALEAIGRRAIWVRVR